MKPTILLSALALATLVIALPFGVQAKEPAAPAAPATTAAPAAKAAAKVVTEKPLPYAGVVDVVDKAKQTFTFKEKAGERTFVVTAETKIQNTVTKQPAKFDDIALNAYVTGSYFKKGDVLEAHSVHLGKTAPVAGEKKAAKPAAPTTTTTTTTTPATKP